MDKNHPTKQLARLGCLCAVLALAACASEQKAPATADVAVSRHAVENAVAAGAAELAPEEVSAARSKMLLFTRCCKPDAVRARRSLRPSANKGHCCNW